MTHYACVEIGDEDSAPVEQSYISAETGAELAAIVAQHCAQWEADLASNYPDSDEFYAHQFREPNEGESNYSQRLRIAGGGAWVLDVRGLTVAEFTLEPDGNQECGQCEGTGTTDAMGYEEQCPVCDGQGYIPID